MKPKDELRELQQKLRTERDELKLKAHLLKAEMRDEWETVEEKWQHFESRMSQKKQAADRAKDEVARTLSKMGDEIKAAYRRIRNSI